MTNPASHGSGPPPFSSYTSTPGGGPAIFRRSSYASVLSGTASSTAPQTFQPPNRSVSHLVNTLPSSIAGQNIPYSRSQQQLRGFESDGHSGSSGSWGRGGQLPPYSSQFGHIGNGHTGTSMDSHTPQFFIPSYLKGSRHAERLEEAHRARIAAQRDAQSRHSSNAGSLSTSSSSVNLHKMVPSHRGMTHDIIERAPVYIEETVAPLPTKWNEADKFTGLEILADGTEVRFSGQSKTHDEAAAVRADHPMPRGCGIYYFEVTVVSKGKEGLIGIGFSGPKVALNRLPGWESESWAYHGDDGMTFCCTASGKPYGPKYSTVDVIGCGVNFRTGCAFFTKNGVNLGIAFRDIKTERLYPSVGMKKPGEHLRVNFGQSPFVFDIDSIVERERFLIQEEISRASVTSLSPPLDENALIQQLIVQYLAHDGYVETVRAFAEAIREEHKALNNGNASQLLKDFDPDENVDAINRQKIRSAILEGDIDRALKYTRTFYPSVLESNENIYFKLRCRKYIEMIRRSTEPASPTKPSTSAATARTANGHSGLAAADDYDVFNTPMELDDQLHNGNSDTANNDVWPEGVAMDTEEPDGHTKASELLREAIQYGQVLRTEFSGDPRREVKKALEDTLALIAYEDPKESSLAWMLEPGERVPVAEELNSAILVSLGKSSSAALERLCQQTEVLVNDLSEDGGAGAFINVRRDFLR